MVTEHKWKTLTLRRGRTYRYQGFLRPQRGELLPALFLWPELNYGKKWREWILPMFPPALIPENYDALKNPYS
jgi:hypothetical protein